MPKFTPRGLPLHPTERPTQKKKPHNKAQKKSKNYDIHPPRRLPFCCRSARWPRLSLVGHHDSGVFSQSHFASSRRRTFLILFSSSRTVCYSLLVMWALLQPSFLLQVATSVIRSLSSVAMISYDRHTKRTERRERGIERRRQGNCTREEDGGVGGGDDDLRGCRARGEQRRGDGEATTPTPRDQRGETVEDRRWWW